MTPPAHAALRLAKDSDPARAPSVEEMILEAVRGIRYGSVEITIHDSQVVQIERTEKLRVNGGR
jgi:hypothetical protein